MKYCNACGNGLQYQVPENDTLPRYVCGTCGHIHYQNPKIVVGTLPITPDKRVLLCKRAIAPRHGYWTLPAGFLENGETLWEGGVRETREEACAEVTEGSLYRIYDLPYINQVYVFFSTRLGDSGYAVGAESSEVRLFAEAEIPWSRLAFPVITEALRDYYQELKNGAPAMSDGQGTNAFAVKYRELANPFAVKSPPRPDRS